MPGFGCRQGLLRLGGAGEFQVGRQFQGRLAAARQVRQGGLPIAPCGDEPSSGHEISRWVIGRGGKFGQGLLVSFPFALLSRDELLSVGDELAVRHSRGLIAGLERGVGQAAGQVEPLFAKGKLHDWAGSQNERFDRLRRTGRGGKSFQHLDFEGQGRHLESLRQHFDQLTHPLGVARLLGQFRGLQDQRVLLGRRHVRRPAGLDQFVGHAEFFVSRGQARQAKFPLHVGGHLVLLRLRRGRQTLFAQHGDRRRGRHRRRAGHRLALLAFFLAGCRGRWIAGFGRRRVAFARGGFGRRLDWSNRRFDLRDWCVSWRLRCRRCWPGDDRLRFIRRDGGVGAAVGNRQQAGDVEQERIAQQSRRRSRIRPVRPRQSSQLRRSGSFRRAAEEPGRQSPRAILDSAQD